MILQWIYRMLFVFMFAAAVYGKDAVDFEDKSGENYKIEQPGTITFTVGAKIKGKVDKPQVMIFLPKEKTVYKEIKLERSFSDELMVPLPFVPISE